MKTIETINFRHGALIRTGPKLEYGGKWNAMLDDTVCSSHTNAELTIYISIFFQQIDPAGANKTGVYGDADDGEIDPKTKKVVSSKKRIQKWAPGEFHRFKRNLLRQAQQYWSGVFWLKTPASYKGLDWPEGRGTHRCNLYCKLELSEAHKPGDAHYSIAVVRARDGESFRSHSRLYSQRDIESENLIDHSTTKFWTHYHEVGHLIGLGHIGYEGHRNLHDNDDKAYGVTIHDMSDVMGKGSVRRKWHALPWQEGAAALTDTKKEQWEVHVKHAGSYPRPVPLFTAHLRK